MLPPFKVFDQPAQLIRISYTHRYQSYFLSFKFVRGALQGGVWEHGGGKFFVCFGKFWHPGNPLFTLACLLFDYEQSWGKHYLQSARAGLASCHNTNEDACTPPGCLGLTRSRRHCMQPRYPPSPPPLPPTSHTDKRGMNLLGRACFSETGRVGRLKTHKIHISSLFSLKEVPPSAPTGSTLSCKTKKKKKYSRRVPFHWEHHRVACKGQSKVGHLKESTWNAGREAQISNQ